MAPQPSRREKMQNLFSKKGAVPAVVDPSKCAAATDPKWIEFDRVSGSSMDEPDSEAPPLEHCSSTTELDDTVDSLQRRATASWPATTNNIRDLTEMRDVAVVRDPDLFTASWSSTPQQAARIRSVSAATSFGSTKGGDAIGAYGSFDSTVTDFDYLTCPGAQAEMSAAYMDAIRNYYGSALGEPKTLEENFPRGMMLQAPFSFPAPPPSSTAGVFAAKSGVQAQMQAAEYEFQAAQLMAQAYQAKANALRMQGEPPQMQISGAFGQPLSGMPSAPYPARAHLAQPSEQAPSVQQKRSATKPSNKKDSLRTTIMLRNLPNDYTRAMLLELLDEQGFGGHYNFLYLPMDFKRKAGLGYAFVNMATPADAERAFSVLQGFSQWKKFSSSKVLEIAWGDPLQGLQPHVDRYKNSPVMHPDVPDEYRPMLFENGVRIEFPPPTRKIREPRLDFRG